MAARPAPRVRRSAEESRRLILDATERRLAAHGPQSIRLQDVAADVGVSHPAVLHHFGSRDGLVKAVVERAVASLETELVRAFALGALDGGVPLAGAHPDAIEALLERASQVLVERGHGRLLAWLLLEGRASAEPGAMELYAIAEAAHARNVRENGARAASFEETRYRFLTAALVLFADAVAGPAMRQSAGLPDDEATRRAYRRWLATWLTPPEGCETAPPQRRPTKREKR